MFATVYSYLSHKNNSTSLFGMLHQVRGTRATTAAIAVVPKNLPPALETHVPRRAKATKLARPIVAQVVDRSRTYATSSPAAARRPLYGPPQPARFRGGVLRGQLGAAARAGVAPGQPPQRAAPVEAVSARPQRAHAAAPGAHGLPADGARRAVPGRGGQRQHGRVRGGPAPAAVLRRAAVRRRRRQRDDVREAAALGGSVDVGSERCPGRGAEAGDGERGGHHAVHDHRAPVDGGRGGGRGVGVAHGEEEQRGVEVGLREEEVVPAVVVAAPGAERREEKEEGAEEDAAQQRGLREQRHGAEPRERAGEVRRREEQEREAAPQPARVGGERADQRVEPCGRNVEERGHQGLRRGRGRRRLAMAVAGLHRDRWGELARAVEWISGVRWWEMRALFAGCRYLCFGFGGQWSASRNLCKAKQAGH
ncbi:hypothetical protein PAHAL_3G282900 [Panicum hallii]|uniref:Uncharacterized protein n=1 Tax=Panicum hallii TaxID=206008 RepID=A0A2T8KJQ1_9POAL|nr:hypothetical protein PAHAL_3G282900 [Panicum hallii]